jgi:hypothetical protein
MNGRSLVVCTLVGTIVLFAWQSISNAALPWHRATMHPFTDTTAASVMALRRQAPANGVYYNTHGVIAVLSATPDYADQTKMIGTMLGRQVAIDLFVAAMLCILAARVRDNRPMAVAAAAGFGALAVAAVIEFSNWNWYGFGIGWTIVNVIDTAISFFIAGWAIAWLARRMGGSVAGVPAGAGYSPPTQGVPVG